MMVIYTDFDYIVSLSEFRQQIAQLNDAKHLGSFGVKINPNSYL